MATTAEKINSRPALKDGATSIFEDREAFKKIMNQHAKDKGLLAQRTIRWVCRYIGYLDTYLIYRKQPVLANSPEICSINRTGPIYRLLAEWKREVKARCVHSESCPLSASLQRKLARLEKNFPPHCIVEMSDQAIRYAVSVRQHPQPDGRLPSFYRLNHHMTNKATLSAECTHHACPPNSYADHNNISQSPQNSNQPSQTSINNNNPVDPVKKENK